MHISFLNANRAIEIWIKSILVNICRNSFYAALHHGTIIRFYLCERLSYTVQHVHAFYLRINIGEICRIKLIRNEAVPENYPNTFHHIERKSCAFCCIECYRAEARSFQSNFKYPNIIESKHNAEGPACRNLELPNFDAFLDSHSIG